ncbi:MAG: TIGR00730 family Rossman fold protein [Candidatus Babeliales bacterium]
MNQILMRYLILFKHLFKSSIQLTYGVWKISHLPAPIVTIFGGARLKQTDFFAQKAHELSHRLVQANISVISGGGTGIMEAVNCGAIFKKTEKMKMRTLGITVKGLEPLNVCAKNFITLDHFFARKWLMINYSVAFAVFPGGFGTLDEFAEVITLLQTQKLLPGVPVILFGRDYWDPFMNWLHESALKYGLVSLEDINLIRITDDVYEAFCLLQERCELCKKCIAELNNKWEQK